MEGVMMEDKEEEWPESKVSWRLEGEKGAVKQSARG